MSTGLASIHQQPGEVKMTVPDHRPKPDLSALRIDREEETESTFSIGRVAGWIVMLAIVAAVSYVVWQRVIVPRRAPLVETTRGQADDQCHQSAAAHRDRLSRRQPAVEDHAEDLRQSRAAQLRPSATKVHPRRRAGRARKHEHAGAARRSERRARARRSANGNASPRSGSTASPPRARSTPPTRS